MAKTKKPRLADRHAEPNDAPLAHTLLHTIEEAQRELRCSRTTVYELHDQGKLQLVKIGRATRVTDESLRALVKLLVEEARAARPAA